MSLDPASHPWTGACERNLLFREPRAVYYPSSPW